MTEYTLLRSKRKTLTIQITKDAQVLVKAPLRLPAAEIERFVAAKSDWIAATLARVQDNLRKKQDFDPVKAGSLLLLGKSYPIRQADCAAFDGSAFLLPSRPYSELKPELVRLYRSLAAQIIPERVRIYSGQTGLVPSGVKITAADTRWGSCSGKNSLCFSWKLIFADLAAVDYVVVHELAHIREHNHSPRFWALVKEILPDYQLRKERLKTLQERLSEEDWN